MLRKLVASLCVVLFLAVAANAGVVAVSTLVANPNTVDFVGTSDAPYNSSPLKEVWVSYLLGVKTDDGSKIASLDININGSLNQKWAFNEDAGGFVKSPNSANASNSDSHLMAGAVVGSQPDEDSNQVSPFPTAPDTAANQFGVGTFLKGAWGYDPPQQAAQVAGNVVNFGYIVIPKGSQPQMNIIVRGATNPEQPGGGAFEFNAANFFGTGPIIPEPATLTLVGLALVGVCGFGRRRS